VAMEAAPTKRSYIRLGAIRLLLEGWERPQVCTIYNRSDRMVRLWIEVQPWGHRCLGEQATERAASEDPARALA
jgi:Homeodomain-like domain